MASLMKKGYIVILAIDEGENLLGKIDKAGNAKHDLVNIILSRWSQLEGMKRDENIKGTYMIMCTTNLPHFLNDPISRRIGTHIECGLLPSHVLAKIVMAKIKYYDKQYRSIPVKVKRNKKVKIIKRVEVPTNIPPVIIQLFVDNFSNLMGGELDNVVKHTFTTTKTDNAMQSKNIPITFNALMNSFLEEYKKKLIIVGKQSSAYANEEAQKVKALIEHEIAKNNESLVESYSKLKSLDISKFGGSFLHLFELLGVKEGDTEELIIDKLKVFVKDKKAAMTTKEFDSWLSGSGSTSIPDNSSNNASDSDTSTTEDATIDKEPITDTSTTEDATIDKAPITDTSTTEDATIDKEPITDTENVTNSDINAA